MTFLKHNAINLKYNTKNTKAIFPKGNFFIAETFLDSVYLRVFMNKLGFQEKVLA